MKQKADNLVSTVNLGILWRKQSLLADDDCDGYPERINVVFGVAPGMRNGLLWAGLINLACRLNMETCGRGITAPVSCAVPQSGMLLVEEPSTKHRLAACLEKNKQGGWLLYGHSPFAMKQMLDCLAMAAIQSHEIRAMRLEVTVEKSSCCLVHRQDGQIDQVAVPLVFGEKNREPVNPEAVSSLTSLAEVILPVAEHDPRGNRLALELELPAELSLACARAVFSLTATAATQATEVHLPVAHAGCDISGGLCFTLEENEDQEAWLSFYRGKLVAKGGPKALAGLLKELERLWFKTNDPGGEDLEKWKSRLHDAALLAAGKGVEGKVAHRLAKRKTLPSLEKQYWSRAAAACRRLGVAEPEQQAVKSTIVRTMNLQGEETRLLAQVAKIPDGRGRTRCRAFLGGILEVRHSFKAKLNNILRQKGYEPESTVLRSYKPAVSWLLEEVEPELPEEVKSLHIGFRPFSCASQMERATRWAQEIYPAPDIVCQKRGWKTEQVQMVMDDKQKHAYTLQAFNSSGKLVAEFELTPPVTELPYLLEQRDDQFVYPTAAGIQLEKDGQNFWSCKVPTDRELFWRRFQEKWLPEMEAAMKAALPELLERKAHAFWEEIRLEIAIEEGQENLDLAEERIAPMEALHEDIYFGLLAFIKAFRKKHCPESNLQLGRIVPMVRSVCERKPRARLRLKPLQHTIPNPQIVPAINRIGYRRGYLSVKLSCGSNSLSISERKRLCIVAGAWGYCLFLQGSGVVYKARRAVKTTVLKPVGDVVAPDVETIPSGEAVRVWTRSLAGRPGIRVWKAGLSLMGRDILAVEATSSGQMSAQKARLLKPTLLINARHHANEVSGSNAAMSLLHELTSGGEAADMLTEANVVVVPLENCDGVATLEEMLSDAPDHKLHAARYNALGMEWYDQYFEPETPFGEAKVKTRLFERWLPEYMLDLHGVPSHEWEQPFAGYLNPCFKQHWIPRSFVYAILPFYDEPDHPAGTEALELALEMSASMEAEKDITELNRQVFDRYQRYAKAFEPEVFDSNLEGSLVVVPTCDRIRKTNFANRKWPLVKSEVITEVLDEVARGPWLERCTRAHLVIIKTMLSHICRGEKAMLVRQDTSSGVIFTWRNKGS